MPNIRISQLSAIGSDLFQDSESFLQELQDGETVTVMGGSIISQVTVGRGFIYLPGRSAIAVRAGDRRVLQILKGKLKAWFDFWDHYPSFSSIRWHLPD